MRQLRLAPALAGLLFALASAPAFAADLDEAVLDEVNFARTHPRAYARELAAQADADPADVDEAVDFLMRQAPLPPLRHDQRLADAAYDHASAQGRTGGLGHVSPGGATLGQRLQRRNLWAGMAAEDISYGHADPVEVVRQLIIDSGVPNRGHRANIFGHYQAAGVGCSRHAAWGAMCVIDFAGAIVQR